MLVCLVLLASKPLNIKRNLIDNLKRFPFRGPFFKVTCFYLVQISIYSVNVITIDIIDYTLYNELPHQSTVPYKGQL